MLRYNITKFAMKNIKFLSLLIFATSSAAAAANKDKIIKLNEIVVTANPLERSSNQYIKPLKILKNDELKLKTRNSLGETLNKELGVNSTFYGNGASRPVIRGLDGDNITILQNGVSTIDASATSVDHNISIDPMSVERIEIIRGPQALFFGSKAIGGVINIIDNRIPDKQINKLVTGTFDTSYNTVDKARAAAIKIKGGESASGLNYQLTTFGKDTNNYSFNADNEPSGKLLNSQSDSKGGSFGVSKIFDSGFVGISYSGLNDNYGIPVDPIDEENIKLESRRTDLAGAFSDISEHIKKITYKIGVSDYNHTEYEGSTPETTFKNNGYDSRIEITHNPIKGFQGAIGLQSFGMNASTIGSDPLLPITDTLSNSLFLYEELPFDDYNLMFGGRTDHQSTSSQGGGNFGNASEKTDLTFSASTGIKYYISDIYTSSLNLGYTQRAPNHQEYFANGPHDATSTYEVGNNNLDVQSSTNIDLSFKKEEGNLTAELNLFYNKFKNYISLDPSGTIDGSSGFEIYNFTGVPAQFMGFEAETKYKLSHNLNGKLSFDYVQAENTRTNHPLPRISPMRLGAGLEHNHSNLTTSLDTTYTFKQNDTAPNETPTDGFIMIDLALDYKINPTKESPTNIYLQATNLLDENARNHISFIKDDVPLPGRSFMIGLRQNF